MGAPILIKIISPFELSHPRGNGTKILLPDYKSTITTMSVIIILLAASISVAALFLAAFIWSVKKGQYDDEFSPPLRILFDDTPDPKNSDTK
jgi:cbb3-type cytochrome oxidase maturation protein